jgi:hypothetical protein
MWNRCELGEIRVVLKWIAYRAVWNDTVVFDLRLEEEIVVHSGPRWSGILGNVSLEKARPGLRGELG